MPVIDALIGLKVLARDGEEQFVPGEVDFNEAGEQLAGLLAKAEVKTDPNSAARPAKKKRARG